jgi:glutaminyl-peptide cyclotransferase
MLRVSISLAIVFLLAACGKGQAPDGEVALKHVKKMVSFGPRYPGSKASAECRAYLAAQLTGATIENQAWQAVTPQGLVKMTNLVAIYPGRQEEIVLLASHYDTKQLGYKWDSANDGPASSAVLLELARVLAGRENRLTYHLVFFDGEEAYREWSVRDGTYGSRLLAAQMEMDGSLAKVKAMILLDMVGDAELNIGRDVRSSPELLELARASAARLGLEEHFFKYDCLGLEDDHTPFLKRGVPAIDLIDFRYGPDNSYWHSKADRIDKLSAGSLGLVGQVVLEMVRVLEAGPEIDELP